MIEDTQIKAVIEAALFAADEPLTLDRLEKLFAKGELDEENARQQLRDLLKVLEEESADRGYELKRVASGYRYQVRAELSEWVSRLWEEKPPRYSRALLETLALVAYRQPVTRGDIEQVRGVSVSQNIMRTLLERGWIRVVGQREVPGRPSMYGTTKAFLDYFNVKSLDELPTLAEIREMVEPILVEEVVAEVAEEVIEAGAVGDDQEAPFEAADSDEQILNASEDDAMTSEDDAMTSQDDSETRDDDLVLDAQSDDDVDVRSDQQEEESGIDVSLEDDLGDNPTQELQETHSAEVVQLPSRTR